MGRILLRVLDTKFENILSRERSLAKAVASAVIGSKSITVWEIMIPILFLFNLFQFKRSRETFTLNFLFTKKLALEAAFDVIDKGKSKEEAKVRIREKTSNILASDKKGIYSTRIRQRQMKETDLLIDHYCRLFKAEGKDYPSMVRNAYQTRENYSAFLEQLEQAEKEVNRAAIQTVRRESANEIVSRMEEAAEKIRMAEVERIFSLIQ